MRIKVISLKGIAPVQNISYDFDQRGGTIGREPGNQLILADPDKHLSRMQAQIVCESGVFVLIDHGGNPTSVNGRPVGRGNRMALADGDAIEAGDYVLRVETVRAAPQFAAGAPAAAPATDPLGLFGGPPSASDPFASPLAAPLAAARPVPPPAPTLSDDPFAVFAAATKPVAAPAQKAPDVDPFAPPPVPAPTPSPLGLDLPTGDSSIDSLFGLQRGTPDALSGRLFDGSTSQLMGIRPPDPNTDPLALLSGAAAPAPAPAAPGRDDAGLMNEAFVPPAPQRPTPAVTQIVAPKAVQASSEFAPAAPPPTPSAPPPGVVVSWATTEIPPWQPGETAPAERTQVLPPSPRPAATPDFNEMPRAPATIVQAPRRPAEAAPSAPIESNATGGNPADVEALLAAFQRGLGAPITPPGGISPAFMEQLGAVLREMTSGTMALLTARALTKREVNAQVTMIVSKGNNPLKFSPDVHFALTQLLAPQGRGFMPPLAAMRDAYDDLRSHQFGVVAGMRAALTGIIARFKPEHLEKRLSTRGFLDSVLPGARKAKLWDLFESMYGDISREAEEDFHSLFGEAFLKAYEEQVDRLQIERNKQSGA